MSRIAYSIGALAHRNSPIGQFLGTVIVGQQDQAGNTGSVSEPRH